MVSPAISRVRTGAEQPPLGSPGTTAHRQSGTSPHLEGIPVNRFTRLFPIAAGLFGITLVFGCTDDATAPFGPEFAQVGTPTVTRCSPQPYASNSAWIGPRGGILKAGNHLLKVPAGALTENTFITMESPSGTVNRVTLSPEGLIFNPRYPAYLAMSYKNCSVPPGAEQQIVHVNESLKIIEITPSQNVPLTLTVEAKLSHFSDYVIVSTYAVAY